MTSPKVNGRFALDVGAVDQDDASWTFQITRSEMARGADAILSAIDPTGHVLLVGTLAEIDAWATDLAAKVTMIQVQSFLAGPDTDTQEGVNGEQRTDRPDHW